MITVKKLSLFFNLTEIFVIVGMMICVYVPMMFPLVFFDKGFSLEKSLNNHKSLNKHEGLISTYIKLSFYLFGQVQLAL